MLLTVTEGHFYQTKLMIDEIIFMVTTIIITVEQYIELWPFYKSILLFICFLWLLYIKVTIVRNFIEN